MRVGERHRFDLDAPGPAGKKPGPETLDDILGLKFSSFKLVGKIF
jgi:hypothetical protein